MKKEDNYLVLVSGGRSSAKVAYIMENSPVYKNKNKLYVFANTGMERPETIEFLKEIVKNWKIKLNIVQGVYSTELGTGVSYELVDFDTLDMNAVTFSKMIEHKTKGIYDDLPNISSPYCSDSLKTQPCKKFADKIFGVNNYIKVLGYRKEDMPKRITLHELKQDKNRIAPLLTDFEYPLGISDLDRFWNEQNFKLKINTKLGNCELCWKKSDNVLIENIVYGTRFVDWMLNEEKKYNSTFLRGRRSIEELVKLSLLPQTGSLFPLEDGYDSCICNF